jgi:hypothetical protein
VHDERDKHQRGDQQGEGNKHHLGNLRGDERHDVHGSAKQRRF